MTNFLFVSSPNYLSVDGSDLWASFKMHGANFAMYECCILFFSLPDDASPLSLAWSKSHDEGFSEDDCDFFLKTEDEVNNEMGPNAYLRLKDKVHHIYCGFHQSYEYDAPGIGKDFTPH